MKSGRSDALKPGKLGSGCKATNCSDAWTGGLGVLPTHDTSPMNYVLATKLTTDVKVRIVNRTGMRPVSYTLYHYKPFALLYYSFTPNYSCSRYTVRILLILEVSSTHVNVYRRNFES